MSTSSQTKPDEVGLVKFVPPSQLSPLTSTSGRLAEDIELYLRRTYSGSVEVALINEGGVAWCDGELVVAFDVVPLGVSTPAGGESR